MSTYVAQDDAWWRVTLAVMNREILRPNSTRHSAQLARAESTHCAARRRVRAALAAAVWHLDRHCATSVLRTVSLFTCVSYAEARNRYRLDVRPSVRHTLARYQNG